MANLARGGRFDRRAALDNAQRLAQQNKVSQAIDAYEQLTRQDPSDWTSANTLGDLLVRAQRADQAIREYLRVAQCLTSTGFLAKAGAIYKKVLRLDPTHAEALRQTEALNSQRFAKPGDQARWVPEAEVRVDPEPVAVAAIEPSPTADMPSAATVTERDDRLGCTWSLDRPDPSPA